MTLPRFSHKAPLSDRRHYVTADEIQVVLGRLPETLWKRLLAVHFNDRGRGGRCLGYVTRARTEITLCALPPRISLARSLRRSQSPSQFGAVRGCQWPALAVRRFMLYDVFLHELGHLQTVDEKAKSERRRFAVETRAQEFAEYWCQELWSKPFDHPDPVHNAPSCEELELVRDHWQAANIDYKQGQRHEKASRYQEAVERFTVAVSRYPGHSMALERLGILTYAGQGTPESMDRSIELLSMAVFLDPALADATLFLAMALASQNREAEARRYFERAILLDRYPAIALSYYADALADWGHFEEAERLFQKAIKRDNTWVVAIRDYGRSLIRHHNPEADNNIERAVKLFERAVALDPTDAESHYRLGNVLPCVDGQVERAIGHLERAIAINPAHARAIETLEDVIAWRDSPADD